MVPQHHDLDLLAVTADETVAAFCTV